LLRRDLFKLAAGAGLSALAGPALAVGNPPARSISLLNLHTGERLNAAYWEGGAYVPDALSALNHVLRDFRTGDVHPMAPGLFDLLSDLGGALEVNETIQVISGYRSPATNALLRSHSDGVAAHSLHMDGLAMDIRLPGVPLERLRDAALALRRGGVGYYPDAASNFVHVDVGRVRRW
jgi:uncharacterized protein YcbK (DUF882 family)